MNKPKALELINQTIVDFQKFVVMSQDIYYKQDAARATDIGAQLHAMKHWVERTKMGEVVNEYRG